MSFNPEELYQSAAGSQWKRVGVKHHHGINTPLFSLHTEESGGIGEYTDLIPFINWVKALGMDNIQILPINDTGKDQSPYNALSAFALNPIHLGLTPLAVTPTLKRHLKELQKLNKTERIDYEKVRAGKELFLHDYYNREFPTLSTTHAYQEFVAQNPWLHAYAAFKALKIRYNWRSSESWGPYIPTDIPARDINFHIFLQYLCFKQMEEVKKHAEKKEMCIQGDIPILISPDSAEVWSESSLFRLDEVAGAPPDMYNPKGQKWGFPLYRWDMMAKDDYRWWRLRLHVAERLYHLYRIDHIVGFFRIWAIPKDAPANEGKFEPANESLWIPQGEGLLRMLLSASSLLPIGEDLGTVPPAARKTMHSLGIPGTKVMRWERNWDTDKSFIFPSDYPAVSLTTVSTHDSETLQQWWKKHPDDALAFSHSKQWPYTPELSLEHHYEILHDSHHSASLFHINLLQEYLALLPNLTWPRLEDERINIPGVISPWNWTYRYRLPFEEIAAHGKLFETIQGLIR
jgi:4-alpha-glucanotransferase